MEGVILMKKEARDLFSNIESEHPVWNKLKGKNGHLG